MEGTKIRRQRRGDDVCGGHRRQGQWRRWSSGRDTTKRRSGTDGFWRRLRPAQNGTHCQLGAALQRMHPRHVVEAGALGASAGPCDTSAGCTLALDQLLNVVRSSI